MRHFSLECMTRNECIWSTNKNPTNYSRKNLHKLVIICVCVVWANSQKNSSKTASPKINPAQKHTQTHTRTHGSPRRGGYSSTMLSAYMWCIKCIKYVSRECVAFRVSWCSMHECLPLIWIGPFKCNSLALMCCVVAKFADGKKIPRWVCEQHTHTHAVWCGWSTEIEECASRRRGHAKSATLDFVRHDGMHHVRTWHICIHTSHSPNRRFRECLPEVYASVCVCVWCFLLMRCPWAMRDHRETRTIDAPNTPAL